ncbi:hypothetical protein FN976_21545 [Caenimonas sedimenti]|uniref:Phosphate ABC transporter substrate-binding protein n=1 Tax=Caenimonas sedimenti TaxID=2596921 RepID=A0A562ZK62_9BURK|nr:hypothetical protein [Caenimonas sedimenti]TWO68979.1 hypothetical protein FN976_21545 [Caenimonas sedimenti]
MKQAILVAGALACASGAFAQTCEGGLYLNPQTIRGEGTAKAATAAADLADFLRGSGLSVAPIVNIATAEDVATALKRRVPPCWVYGNPVVGFASGYQTVAVNKDSIQAAVLVVAEVGTTTDAKPVEISKLPPNEQAQVLAKLKATTCMGIRSGVTTALVRAEKLCGTMVDVQPQQGLGQAYLPTKASFHWQPDRWVGLVMRVQGAKATSMKSLVGANPRIHNARLIVVPTAGASWGYGLYVRADAPADATRKATRLFTGLRGAEPALLRALDANAQAEFVTPPDAEVDAMRRTLDMSL